MGRNNADFQMGKQNLPEQMGDSESLLKEMDEKYPFDKPEKKMVNISDIKSVQTYVHGAKVQDMSKKHQMELPPVHLWKNEEGLHVIDGNHRINAALARGENKIFAHVWSKND